MTPAEDYFNAVCHRRFTEDYVYAVKGGRGDTVDTRKTVRMQCKASAWVPTLKKICTGDFLGEYIFF